MRVLFLGTGTSSGVPSILCQCPVCLSDNPKNKRLRSSILVTVNGRNILVDTATDLREQALRYRVGQVDAVLFTHAHADHVHGIDEIRVFSYHNAAPVPCYGNEETIATIHRQFPYIFVPEAERESFVPRITTHVTHGPFRLFEKQIVPVPIGHGKQTILGYRIGGFAYLGDCNRIPPESEALLQGLEVLVLDALRDSPHPTHFSLDQAVAAAQALRPKRTLFTHMAHQLDHDDVNGKLPPGMALAYDGQILELNEPF